MLRIADVALTNELIMARVLFMLLRKTRDRVPSTTVLMMASVPKTQGLMMAGVPLTTIIGRAEAPLIAVLRMAGIPLTAMLMMKVVKWQL